MLDKNVKRLKSAIAQYYIRSRPDHYEVQFQGTTVRFLTDRPYTKKWYYRNRLKRAAQGYHEPPMTFLLGALAANKKMFLDIGSHLGYFSILFATVNENRALAVELDPTNFRELDRCFSWQPEHVRGRLFSMNAGVYDADTSMQVPHTRAHNSSHRIDSQLEPDSETVDIRLLRIDALIEEKAVIPDIVKIDVEGFEVHALRGGSDLLTNTKPVLMIEIHPTNIRSLGERISEIVERTQTAGYRHFQFLEHRGLSGSRLVENVNIEGDTNRDLICIHTDDKAGLDALTPFF